MSSKDKNYYSKIGEELDWLTERAEEIKAYVDANPYHLVTDRTITKYSAKGNAYEDVVQKAEAIQDSLRKSLKEYAQLIEMIDTLREKEEAKSAELRGGKEASGRMAKLIRGE